jgi:hypothetical protein
MTRRRNVNRKFKEEHQTQAQPEIENAAPGPEPGDKNLYQETQVVDKQAEQEDCIPVAAALKILAGELESGGQEDTLCRAAVRLAEEGGIIAGCRPDGTLLRKIRPAVCLYIYLTAASAWS